MIESIILRCVASASFAAAIESRSFAAATRLATAWAMRIESACVMSGVVTACGATGGAGGLSVVVLFFDDVSVVGVPVTDVTGAIGGGRVLSLRRVTA